MSHPYPHQDWETVVLHKPTPKKESSGGGGPKPPQEGDEFKLPKVGKDLKLGIMQARIAKKWSQKELANRCGVGEDLIKKMRFFNLKFEHWKTAIASKCPNPTGKSNL